MKVIENHKVNGKEIVYKEDAEDILRALMNVMDVEGGEPDYDNEESVKAWSYARTVIRKVKQEK